MSESAEIKLEFCQNASNSDFVENGLKIEAKLDGDRSPVGDPLIKPDVDHNCVEPKSKTIDKSESEPEFAICGTGMTRVTQLNGMRHIHTNGSTQPPDVCSGSQHTDTDNGGVDDGMCEESGQDSDSAQISSALPDSDNQKEVIIIETIVKTDSNEVTLITDTTLNTHSSDHSKQCSDDYSSETNINNKNNSYNNNNNKNKNNLNAMTTTRPKQLKSLLKKNLKENSIKTTNNEKRRVRFSETMQVFCDDWPQNLMPQIIALKSPTDFNLVEVQGYMFEPPVEYQDFLPFEPPPDYRDFIANSLCGFDRDLNINYIDEDIGEDDDNSLLLNSNLKSDQKFLNEFSSKWESMILNNNESLEEEQIIGVLKEDAILQAIGSHVSLPEEQLCPEDFPIHFQNIDNSCVKLAESELSDIASEDGNDSSPTGSLQDIQSDSSITSQDTIILMNSDSNDNNESNDKMESFSNKKCFNEINTGIEDQINSESVVNCSTETNCDQNSTNYHCLDHRLNNESNCETNDSLISEKSNDSNSECVAVEGEGEEEVDSTPDVRHDMTDRKEGKSRETHETHESDCESQQNTNIEPNTDSELNINEKQFNLFTTEESNDLRTNHSNAFKRNLMFYENMFSDNNIKSDNNYKTEKPLKESLTVSHFIVDNNPKYPIITQKINNNINNENNFKQINETSIENKQKTNEINSKPINLNNSNSRAPIQQTQQTQQNQNNWATDEFIIEYTSEPRALVPSKRTASLSNFATNPQMVPIRSTGNANNNNIQYLSLNRNGEIPKQWTAYNVETHNNSQQIRYQYPPIQRSLSPNPPLVSANVRPVSQQQVYYQNRPQYNPRYSSTHTMPVHVMYNRMVVPQSTQHTVSVVPVMTQHKQPPPYHYHIQQHNNEFPNPSEIRRRDGLNAHPYVLNQTPQAGALPVPPMHHNSQNGSGQSMSKDELEQFVQQDIQRTERIKKRYSLTEEDDPSFGFARRPSVRGIRPKFGTTNEILKQFQTQTNNNCAISSQMTGSHVSWPQISSNNNNQQNQSFPKKEHIVHIVRYPMSATDTLPSHPKQSSQSSHPLRTPKVSTNGPQMSRTLPRPSSLISQSQFNAIRTEDGLVIRLPANASREQIERQLEQQLQPKLKQTISSMSSTNVKPVMSSNDERGAPEGASSSPKHSSDLLFAKNLGTNSNPNVKSSEMSVNIKTINNRQQTNDTKKLVLNEQNKAPNDTEAVIYYAMNV